jgi:CheY-like chemotaxis protein/signal transduction histidine kinase
MDPIRPTNDSFFMRHATKIAIGAVTALMLLAAVTFWRQGEASEAAKGWVLHTYEVIGHIELLFGKLKDAEVGERGFIISGNEDYLEPYENALREAANPDAGQRSLQQHRSIAQELAFIRKLTADNPAQQNNLDELDDTVKKLLTYLAATIQERKEEAAKAAGSKPDLQRGKALMDQARSLVRIMEAEENHLLQLRGQVAETHEQEGNRLTLIAMSVFYVAITLSIWLYQRARAHAQAQAQIYTQELETREEELKRQQEELKTSNEEIEASNEELKMQQEELKASNEEIEASNEELEEKTSALEEQNARIRQQSQELEKAKHLIEEKARQLEQSSKYKSEFLANMSHELRTPLNSLLILARCLAANEEGNLTEEQIEEAKVIHNGGLELLGLINDILDLSKVEAGMISIVPEDIYISNIAKRMSQQFEPVAKENGVAFHIRVDESLPEILRTDGQRVEQIMKNLLSNAFKFTEVGSVTLDMHRVKDDVELQRASLAASETIAFSVIDTGIGIEESKFKDIFEAFQQEDGSTDRHYGGTGLGLTIARKFAHVLGGEIQVASGKGEGSMFTLFLPLLTGEGSVTVSSAAHFVALPVPRADGATEIRAMPKASVRIFIPDDRKSIGPDDKVLLIIEDDRDFAMTLMKIARKRGYKCLGAGDGKSGLLLAAEQDVTAIILDLRLPDIDGMRVLDQLKDNLKTRHIPVHIISGMADLGTLVPLKKGAIGYLAKPASIEDIDGVFTRIEGLLHSEVKKVLVVEDDENTQTAIQSLLKQKNIEIIVTGTGNAALKQMRETAFDCIILDLKLPDMTGFEWLQAVEKAAGEEGAPPIIIYTAKELSEEENRQLSRHTGSIVIKGASSSERLLDEVTLFLHSVASTLSKDQQAMIRMQHDPDRALQNRTAMLVDDDMRNTFALSKLLKKHGMNVVIADNGQMALETLKEQKNIELVIMDIMMPVMDGYQAMREIRACKDWQGIPIIALTARAMPEEQERCMEAGADDYLVKPVDIDRLLTLLRVWLFKQERAA